jgi:divalent metal cation (Fe/Co/Zn/Cd) transporter
MRTALWLVSVTLAYNIVEALVALWSGAQADSIALFGFGLDSVIETAAAAILLWRLRMEAGGAEPARVERAEARAMCAVGVTFLLLAGYVGVQSVRSLLGQAHPGESVAGIILATFSLVLMPLLAWAKLRTARHLGSAALRAEAKETIACAYLSLALLLGLGLNAAAAWWWADPVAALLMVPWLLREGIEGIRGECGEGDTA